jgi:putative resolvase
MKRSKYARHVGVTYKTA